MFLIAQFISIISNPLLFSFPTSFALVYRTTGNLYYSLWWALFSFLVTFIIAIFVLYGVRRKFFSDFDVSVRPERRPLFIFGALTVFIYAIVILVINGPKVLLVALTGVALGIFCDSIINTRIKASIHVATYTAFALGIALLYGGVFTIFIVLIPIVAWSRVTVKRHSLQETIVGALLGATLVVIMYLLVKLLVQ